MLDTLLLEAYYQTNYKFDDTLLNIDKTSSQTASFL